MIKVNLVPKDILDRETQRQRQIQFGAIAAASVLILAVVSLAHYTRAVSMERQLDREKRELDSLKAIVGQVEQLEGTAQAVRARLGVIQELLVGRPLYPYFMEDLVETFPSGLWIQTLSTSAEGSGLKVGMSAKANTQEDVSRWLRTLDSSKKFSTAQMGSISIDASGVSSFSMNVKYTPDLKGPRR